LFIFEPVGFAFVVNLISRFIYVLREEAMGTSPNTLRNLSKSAYWLSAILLIAAMLLGLVNNPVSAAQPAASLNHNTATLTVTGSATCNTNTVTWTIRNTGDSWARYTYEVYKDGVKVASNYTWTYINSNSSKTITQSGPVGNYELKITWQSYGYFTIPGVYDSWVSNWSPNYYLNNTQTLSTCPTATPSWDRSSLVFTAGCDANCTSVTGTVLNHGSRMSGTTTYEIYYAASGNAKNGSVVASGTIPALNANASYTITYNPQGVTGNYIIKVYQRPGHPGTGELWSDGCSINYCPRPTATPVTPTATPVTPTATPITPTATPVTPTATPVTPTATPVTPTKPPAPTKTPVTPTATPVTPTATPVTPTATPVTPTATPVTPTEPPAPTNTPVTPTEPPAPTNTPVTPTEPPASTNTPVPPTEVPPTAVPPTEVPPTEVPPTEVPPTAVPPTAVPPTAVPPTEVPPTQPPAPTEIVVTEPPQDTTTPEPVDTTTPVPPEETQPPVVPTEMGTAVTAAPTDTNNEGVSNPPTAAPPSQSYSNTTVLIPVTGADQLATLRTILFNLGLTLLGLGFILKGLSRRS